jgi:hypothetical protein
MPILGSRGAGAAGGFGLSSAGAVINPYPGSVDYLVVSGGGAGGGGRGGGGGAGGMLTSFPGGSKIPLSPGPHSVTIGGGASSPGGIDIGPNGSPSEFKSTGTTGGGGGTRENTPSGGSPGGSGGGGACISRRILEVQAVQEDLEQAEKEIQAAQAAQRLQWLAVAAVEKTLQEQLAQLATPNPFSPVERFWMGWSRWKWSTKFNV